MPRGNQTGPMGMGPKTGRGLGYCNNFNDPGFINQQFGQGLGKGFRRGGGFQGGRGAGRRNQYRFFGQSPSYGMNFQPDMAMNNTIQEKEYLVKQVDLLQNQISEINERLSELNSTGDSPD